MTRNTDFGDKSFELGMPEQAAVEPGSTPWAYGAAPAENRIPEPGHDLALHQLEPEMRNELPDKGHLKIEEPGQTRRDAYDLSPVRYLTLAPNGLIVDIDPTPTHLLSEAGDSLVGNSVYESVRQEDCDALHRHHCRVATDVRTNTYEINVVNENGVPFFALLQAFSVPSESAEQSQYRMVLTETTNRTKGAAGAQPKQHTVEQYFQNHETVMLVIDPDMGQIIGANQLAERYYGCELSQLRGLTIQQINTLSPDEIAGEHGRALPEKRNYFHFPHGLANGQECTVEVYSSPIELGDRRLLFSILHDITDRKTVEETIGASEEKFRLIFEASPDAISLTRECDGAFLDVNRGFVEESGYSRDEALSRKPSDLNIWAYPEDRERILEQLEANGRVQNCEAQFRRKDGSIFSGLVSAVRLSVDGEPCVLSLARSIEPQKKAEADLKIQRDMLAAVFETAPFIMMVVDNEGRISHINRAGEVFSGRPKEELERMLAGEMLGCTHFTDVSEREKPDPCTVCPIRSRVRRTLETGESIFSEEGTFTVRKGSQEITLHLLISTALLKVGDADAVLLTLEDVTDRKRAEQEKALLQKQLLLAQKMESIGTLAGGIAHDFNNLLQVVLGYADMLLYGKGANEPDYEELHAIRQAGRDGSELAKRILAFSQRLEPNARPICLNNEIRRLEKMLTRMIPKMIRIESNLADAPFTVNADPGQMEQIMLNLVVNAQHAMPDGGQLRIETANVVLDKKACRTRLEMEPGDYVLLTVSDTGCGMDKEVMDRIFEPFFTTKKPGQGTGLGLAMVYGIVRSHKGHIQCYSQKGEGTTFKIYLPAVTHEFELPVTKTRHIAVNGTETILLVDDELLIRVVGERNLRNAGYNVLTAANGKEALQLYEAHRNMVDLVLLDMIMPEMGGKQCLKELLKINPNVRVIVASGYAVECLTAEVFEAGIRGFIGKPYDAQDLLSTVRKTLDEPEQ